MAGIYQRQNAAKGMAAASQPLVAGASATLGEKEAPNWRLFHALASRMQFIG